MAKKIRDYIEYRRNRKTVRREMTALAASLLPVISKVNSKITDIAAFILKLVNLSKNMDGSDFFRIVLSEISEVLQTDNDRLIEILSYIAQQTPEDIHKILADALVETNRELKDKE